MATMILNNDIGLGFCRAYTIPLFHYYHFQFKLSDIVETNIFLNMLAL